MSDLIKRSDAIKIMACEMYAEAQSQGYEVDSIEDFMPEAKTWMNDAPSVDTDLSGYSDKLWKNAYERGKADRPQEWVDKAISIIDDMQREGIIDYEQAWDFRMRARIKGVDDEVQD